MYFSSFILVLQRARADLPSISILLNTCKENYLRHGRKRGVEKRWPTKRVILSWFAVNEYRKLSPRHSVTPRRRDGALSAEW